MTAESPTAPRRSPWRGARRRISAIPRILSSIPVTLLSVAALLLAGVLTGTLFASANPNDVAITSLEFGLPAFREGRLWTLFTGAVTFTEPEFYYLVGAMLAVGLGVYERRVGSLRAAAALLITHAAGIVLPALLLWPFAGSDWTWAARLGGELDAGLSAGGFGVAAAATALLRPPWRGRLRVLGTAFLIVMVLKSGLLWDLEHFAAWTAGLVIGPWLAGPTLRARRDRAVRLVTASADPVAGPTRTPPPQEARILTALIGAGFALSNVVESLYPGLGGLVGPGVGSSEVRGFWLIVLELVISLLIAGALPRPQAVAWWVAVFGVSMIAVNSLVNTPVLARVGDVVCALIVLTVLIWNRDAWPWRTDRDAVRPVALLVAMAAVYTAVSCVAIWAIREQFRPNPDLWQVLREAVARFTFTTGPLAPTGGTARGVVMLIDVIWALTLIGWLLWALYLWRRSGGRKHGTGVVGPRFYSVKVGALDENTQLDTVHDTDPDTEQERPSHD